ncbi:MAG TPA: thioredoxin family protein [Polyangiaceae bacterium]|nr:thioredoxin family protein [Polyangiaceae bacterium]
MMRARVAALSVALAAAGCSSRAATDTAGSASGAPSAAPSSESASASAPASATPSRFTEGDLDGALARAKAEKKLVFVDLWAPWCDACLALKSGALASPALADFDASFVFVAVDVDKPDAAGFIERHGVRELPTLAVIDPEGERVVAQRIGELAVADVVGMLTSARAGAEAERGARASLEAARALVAKGDPARAAKLFRDVASKSAGALHDEASIAALGALLSAEDFAACAALAEDLMDAKPPPGQPVMVLRHWVRCASLAPKDAARTRALEKARAKLAEVAKAPPSGVSALDLSDVHALLAELARDRDEDGAARSAEEARERVLARAASEATTPLAREAFDHERVNVLRELGRDDDAVRLLEERAKERPDAYETHGRLGTLLLDLGRASAAVAPLSRAVALGYGAPRLVYMGRLAEAYAATGEAERSKSTLVEEVAGWRALPPGQRDPAREADAEKRLEAARRAAH